jgi:hypothetical protein
LFTKDKYSCARPLSIVISLVKLVNLEPLVEKILSLVVLFEKKNEKLHDGKSLSLELVCGILRNKKILIFKNYY